MDRYSDTVSLIMQFSKHHLKFNCTWNYITKHPNMANNTISKTKEEFSQPYTILYSLKQK